MDHLDPLRMDSHNQAVRQAKTTRDDKAQIAYTPPADGKCWLESMPNEVFRGIFSEFMPPRDDVIAPTCNDHPRFEPGDEKSPNPRGQLVDLLTLNKSIRNQLSEIIYEERTFSIHIHQGIRDAGIEFLHVGRQPLQYLDNLDDARFDKFRTGEMFGFHRLQKIRILIFPSNESSRHTAINTYFMSLALSKLLARDGQEKNRIVSIDISFIEPVSCDHRSKSGRAAIMAAENLWWDPDKQRARETSIHGISDLELVLRPFANLSAVHNVEILLPYKLQTEHASTSFASALKSSMEAPTPDPNFTSDELERKIESARYGLDDYINKTLFGGTWAPVPKLTEAEIDADRPVGSEEIDQDGTTTNVKPSRSLSQTIDSDCFSSGKRKRFVDFDATERPEIRDHDFDAEDEYDDFLFGDDAEITANPLSEKVAQFAYMFQVSGDIARRVLDRVDNNLDRAVESFITDRERVMSFVGRREKMSESTEEPSTLTDTDEETENMQIVHHARPHPTWLDEQLKTMYESAPAPFAHSLRMDSDRDRDNGNQDEARAALKQGETNRRATRASVKSMQHCSNLVGASHDSAYSSGAEHGVASSRARWNSPLSSQAEPKWKKKSAKKWYLKDHDARNLEGSTNSDGSAADPTGVVSRAGNVLGSGDDSQDQQLGAHALSTLASQSQRLSQSQAGSPDGTAYPSKRRPGSPNTYGSGSGNDPSAPTNSLDDTNNSGPTAPPQHWNLPSFQQPAQPPTWFAHPRNRPSQPTHGSPPPTMGGFRAPPATPPQNPNTTTLPQTSAARTTPRFPSPLASTAHAAYTADPGADSTTLTPTLRRSNLSGGLENLAVNDEGEQESPPGGVPVGERDGVREGFWGRCDG